jgi:hypothetical protein
MTSLVHCLWLYHIPWRHMQMTINVPYSLTGLRMHADILIHCTDINFHNTCIELYDLFSPLIVTAPYSLMTINVPYFLTGLRMHADILMHCTDINIHTTCIELYDLLSPLIVTAPYSLMTINVPYSLTGLKMHADILINCTNIYRHPVCGVTSGFMFATDQSAISLLNL